MSGQGAPVSTPSASAPPHRAPAPWLARLHRFEDWVLTLLVIGLVVLAGAQILLRNVFEAGLSWADPLLRALVLWSAMLGALVATREQQHIGLDFLARFSHGALRRGAHVVASLFACALCAAMAWYSVGLVRLDLGGGGKGVAGIPAWALETIMPLGFGLMALRFLLRAFAAPAADPTAEPSA